MVTYVANQSGQASIADTYRPHASTRFTGTSMGYRDKPVTSDRVSSRSNSNSIVPRQRPTRRDRTYIAVDSYHPSISQQPRPSNKSYLDAYAESSHGEGEPIVEFGRNQDYKFRSVSWPVPG